MAVDLGSATGYIDLDISGFVAAANEAKKTLNNTTTQMKSYVSSFQSGLENVSKTLSTVGKVMSVAFTTPIVAGFKKALDYSKNFESAMSQVQATMGITANSTSSLNGQLVNTKDALADLAEQLGAATKFTATEAAEAINNLAMAGYDTQKIYDTLPTVLSLASAGALDLDYACQLVANGLNVMGLSTENATELADKLAVTASSAYGSVSDFGEGILVAGGQAQIANVSLTDTLTALGILGDNGMSASEGGTMLRNVLKNLYTPTDTAAQALAELGIETADADGNLRNVQDVLKDLNKALSNLTADEKVNAMAKIFDTRTIAGANALLSSCGERWDELSTKIEDASGAAEQMANTQLDNLAGSFELLSSAVEAFAQSLGELLTPYIRKIVDQLTEWVDQLNSLSDSEKEQIIKIGLIVAAMGPALLILSKIISAVGTLITVIKTVGTVLSAVISPAGLVVAAIAAIGVAIYELWQRSETFREIITGVIDEVKSAFIDFKNKITEKLAEVGITTDTILATLKNLWNGFVAYVGPLVTGVFQSISTVISTALDTILAVADVFIGIFTGDWERAFNGVKDFVTSIWKGIAEVFGIAITSIKNAVDGFLKNFGTSWEEVWTNISDFFSNIWQGIVNFFTNAWNSIVNVWNNFKNKFGAPWTEFWNGVKNVFSGIWTGVKLVFTKSLDTLLAGVKAAVKGIASVVGIFNKDWGNSMKEWADSTITTTDDIAENVKDATLKVVDDVKSFVAPVIETTKTTLTNAGEIIKEQASDIGKELVESYEKGVAKASKSSKIAEELAEPVEESESLMEKAANAWNDFFNGSTETTVNTATEGTAEIETQYTGLYNTIKANANETYEETKKNSNAAVEEIKADSEATTQFLSDSESVITQEYVDNLQARIDEYTAYYNNLLAKAEENSDEELAVVATTYEETIAELEAALAKAEELVNNATTTTSKEVEKTGAEIQATSQETANSIVGDVETIADENTANALVVKDTWTSTLQAIKTSTSSECSTIKQYQNDVAEYLSDSNNKVTDDYISELETRISEYKKTCARLESLAQQTGDEEVATNAKVYSDVIKNLENYVTKAKKIQDSQKEYVIASWDGMTKEISNKISTVENYYSSAMDKITGVTDALHDYLDQEREQQMDDIQDKIDKQNSLYEELAQREKDLNAERLQSAQETYNADLEAAKNSYDEKLLALQELNAQGLLSDQDYKTQKELLDTEYATNKETLATNLANRQAELETELTEILASQEDERAAYEHEQLVEKDKIARQSFEAQQATDIATAVINAAQAILKGYAQGGFILGSIYAALTAAATAIQIATIKKQKYTPLLAKGGIVDEATLAVVGEQGKEVIMPLENNTEWIDMLAQKLSSRTTNNSNCYNITFNSPRSIDEFEARRQMKIAVRNIAEGF